MNRWRHWLVAAWLALALVAGQQLVMLHALGHAAERIADKDRDAAHCKIHFACSQLASAMSGKALPTLPLSMALHAAPMSRDLGAHLAPDFTYLSTGPPQASA
ncbi:MAG TPA: hypothetical protein VFE23_05350 [Usitatibacter sp.]|jgi:hypothetical protein|nr:hypothetical protein [Usitatibacter sp.]